MSTDPSRRDTPEFVSSVAPDSQADKLTEAIVRSQHNYRELIDSLDQALFTLTLDGVVRVANRRLTELLGVTFKELIGQPLGDFIESPTLGDAQRALPHLLNAGKWSGGVPVRLKKDRTLRYFDCWLQASVEGTNTSITGWARDVTDHREMEKRLAEEQSFTRRLVAGFPDLVAVLDREGQFIYVSDHVEKVTGFKAQSYVGRVFGARANEEDQHKLHAMFESIIRGETAEAQVEFRSSHADGGFRDLLLTARPFYDEEGRICGLVTATRDISERKRMEKKLQQEQQFVKSLVECFPDLIMVLNKEGEFEFVSDRIKDVLGVTPAEYIGKPVGQRIEPGDLAKLRAMFQAALAGQKDIEQIEIHAQHVNGTIKTVRVAANALYDEKGNIVGMVSSGRDVTESKHLEQQLADKEKFASMGQMMAGAAHELNNPLTAILGVSDLLRDRATDDATRRQIDLILQQARRAATIVQNLLAFSRPVVRGRTTLRLDEIVKEAISIERTNLERRNIQLKFTAPDGPLPIDADRKLLLQVFLNIISNAEQSISPAREQGHLAISIAREGDKIGVTFADDGPGIPADIIGKIFDPFFTTKRPGGGSGLGLTISLAVIKEHGGTIAVESKPGEGAVVRVMLPAATEMAATPEPAPPVAKSAPALAQRGGLSGHSVLVVDDEEGIREIVQEGLSGQGMKVHAVESSEAALAWLAANKAEIVVCDFNLPKMNGEKLFEELHGRLRLAAPQFVFMTGELVSSSVAERYQEMGARVLQKPFALSALAALIAELLEPHSSPAK